MTDSTNTNNNSNSVSAGTIIRTVLLILALVNQLLVMTGHSVLPISDEQVTEIITTAFTVITALVAWWKNNSFTESAIKADEYMKGIKEG